MPPDNSEHDLKEVNLQAPGEAPQRWSYDEVPDTEEAEPMWSKDNPYLHLSTDAQQALKELGKACAPFSEALGRLTRAIMDALAAILSYVNRDPKPTAEEIPAALNMAPPRVRHLAEHGKKYRTRKKNMHRAMRAYKRRR